MFDNKYIADRLQTLAKLLEVNGAEASRVRDLQRAANIVRRLEQSVGELFSSEELETVHGIGLPLRKTIEDIYATGISPQLEHLLEEIPDGVVQMLDLNGLGPKKARVIWRGMGIDNLDDLHYACVENRLVEEKGFGLKTQEKIRGAIEHLRNQGSKFLYATLLPHAVDILAVLSDTFGEDARFALTGEMRRKMPIASRIAIVCEADLYKDIMLLMIRSEDYEMMTAGTDLLQVVVRDTAIHIDFLFPGINYYYHLFRSTGPETHVEQMEVDPGRIYLSEEEIYTRAGLPFIAPELRDHRDIAEVALGPGLPSLVEFGDLKGILHAHSTWSDGLHTLEEMAIATREMGLQYLGITDHSQSLTPANGLSVERVEAQKEEIDRLNRMLHPFRILKGIEVEILPNGDLDYDSLTLAGFDFVIASLHSDTKMDKDEATRRLLKAIRNPFTNILGHPTGRFLLGREGYPIDHRAVIDACAENRVAIELNCSPYRMDLDWSWVRYAVERGVQIALNPDAHRKEDLSHVHLGIGAGRKGMLPAAMTLNARDLAGIEEFFMEKRKHRIS